MFSSFLSILYRPLFPEVSRIDSEGYSQGKCKVTLMESHILNSGCFLIIIPADEVDTLSSGEIMPLRISKI